MINCLTKILIPSFFVSLLCCQRPWAEVPTTVPTQPLVQQTARHPWYDYTEGKIDAARQGYLELVKRIEASHDTNSLWDAYMGIAWFYHQLGEDAESIPYANKALVVARKNNNEYQIARSLAWLAWSYADMGLYDFALVLYQQAIDISAPAGRIKYVSAWGMSTQEMGYVYFRRGDLKKAKELIETTTTYARSHGILVGVSEGAAHLAEIALSEGSLKQAEVLAKEAVDASLKCNCSPLNTARAQLVLAKAIVATAGSDPARSIEARRVVDNALEYAQKVQAKRFIAEENILLSKLLPTTSYEQRLALVSSAYDLLNTIQNEQRGIASTELGATYLTNNHQELAKFYLEQGLEVNTKLLRTIDRAFVHADLATLSAIQGETRTRLENLSSAFELAVKSNHMILRLQNSEQLCQEYSQLGYFRIAAEWCQQGVLAVDSLLSLENPSKTKQSLYQRKMILVEQLVEINLTLRPETPRVNNGNK